MLHVVLTLYPDPLRVPEVFYFSQNHMNSYRKLQFEIGEPPCNRAQGTSVKTWRLDPWLPHSGMISRCLTAPASEARPAAEQDGEQRPRAGEGRTRVAAVGFIHQFADVILK